MDGMATITRSQARRRRSHAQRERGRGRSVSDNRVGADCRVHGFEVVVGIVAHSLALLSDAAHMLTDAGAIALSLVILRYVQRPGGEALT